MLRQIVRTYDQILDIGEMAHKHSDGQISWVEYIVGCVTSLEHNFIKVKMDSELGVM